MQSNQPNANPKSNQPIMASSAAPPLGNSPDPVQMPVQYAGSTIGQWVKRSLDITTPQIMRRSMFGLWGVSLIWMGVSINAIQTQRNAIKTIAKDSIPSVLVSLRLVSAMADMDASVSKILLNPDQKDRLIQPTDIPPEKNQPKLTQLKSNQPEASSLTPEQKYFNQRRADLAERLTRAAQNITAPEEKPVIQELVLDFGDYLAYLERAQAAQAKGDRQLALQEYQRATTLLDQTLIPNAYQLRDINHRVVEERYREAKGLRGKSIESVILLGLATIGGLIALQWFLTQRTQRVLNPLLLGATATAILFFFSSMQIILSSNEDLRVLKEDSYNSLIALRNARVLIYIANSNESRYLLDPANKAAHEKKFFDSTNQAFDRSNSPQFMQNVIQRLAQNDDQSGIRGEFAIAINNITSRAEREELTVMMTKFQAYMAFDRQVRDLVQQNQTKAAIALVLEKSNAKFFDDLRNSITKLIDMNENVLKQAESDAMGQLDQYELKAAIALALIATLIFFGLQPRLKEYS